MNQYQQPYAKHEGPGVHTHYQDGKPSAISTPQGYVPLRPERPTLRGRPMR